jgi:hypothetical protein
MFVVHVIMPCEHSAGYAWYDVVTHAMFDDIVGTNILTTESLVFIWHSPWWTAETDWARGSAGPERPWWAS